MRFLTSDPAQDGWNWYAYANGNPMSELDLWSLNGEDGRFQTTNKGRHTPVSF